jgi:hypothetical protein
LGLFYEKTLAKLLLVVRLIVEPSIKLYLAQREEFLNVRVFIHALGQANGIDLRGRCPSSKVIEAPFGVSA